MQGRIDGGAPCLDRVSVYFQVITTILNYVGSDSPSVDNRPAKLAAQFVCCLSTLMLVLSCLLICFHARDEIEIELLKAGVMSEDDIEAIRRLKESNHVQINRGSISLDSIDSMKRGIFTRKRMNRISPTSDMKSSSSPH